MQSSPEETPLRLNRDIIRKFWFVFLWGALDNLNLNPPWIKLFRVCQWVKKERWYRMDKMHLAIFKFRNSFSICLKKVIQKKCVQWKADVTINAVQLRLRGRQKRLLLSIPPLLFCLSSISLILILLQSGHYFHSNRLLQPGVSMATAGGPEGRAESGEPGGECWITTVKLKDSESAC